MAESFDNLSNILHDWAKDEVQKSLVEALNRNESLEEERKVSFLENDSEKILEQSQSALNQTQS